MKQNIALICSFLLPTFSHAAVVLSAETTAPTIQHSALWDGEGNRYTIIDSASALAPLAPIAVTTNTTQIALSLLAPEGQKYLVDTSAYGFNPTLAFNICLTGTNLPYVTGPGVLASFNLLNADGISITYLQPNSHTSFSQEHAYWYTTAQFSGSGTFEGIEVTLNILNLGNQPLTWFSGDTVSSPNFYFFYDNVTDNGSVLSLVPEPSTYALFGLGALGLMVVCRRREA